jgi:hypothetical protein
MVCRDGNKVSNNERSVVTAVSITREICMDKFQKSY